MENMLYFYLVNVIFLLQKYKINSKVNSKVSDGLILTKFSSCLKKKYAGSTDVEV